MKEDISSFADRILFDYVLTFWQKILILVHRDSFERTRVPLGYQVNGYEMEQIYHQDHHPG